MTTSNQALKWLGSIGLGYLKVLAEEKSEFRQTLKPLRQVKIGSEIFPVFLTSKGKPLVATRSFRLYPCELPDGRFGVMKVSTDKDPNDDPLDQDQIQRNTQSLEQEARRLQEMRTISIQEDEHYPKGSRAFHHSQFPEVVASIAGEGRFMMFLGFPRIVDTPADLQAIIRLMTNESGQKQRIDLKSAWIYGKLLKALNFAHAFCNVANKQIEPWNVLISPEDHAVVLFDWRNAAEISSADDPRAIREVIQAAQIFVDFAGGHWIDGKLVFPYDEDLMTEAQLEKFERHFERILLGTCGSAYQEHRTWYALLDETWGSQFHPFKLYVHPIS